MSMAIARSAILMLLLALLAPGSAAANPVTVGPGQDVRSSYMRAYGPTDPPYAFWRFCDEFPADCSRTQAVPARLDASKGEYQHLVEVNLSVNKAIEPVTDMELYGISDYWTLPTRGKGDCEDYALLKRHILIASGWPSSALLITVVRDEAGEGHAVLTARTLSGDYILDNKTDDVKLWRDTPYRFIMRQSYLDPRSWVALDPAQSAPPAAIADLSR